MFAPRPGHLFKIKQVKLKECFSSIKTMLPLETLVAEFLFGATSNAQTSCRLRTKPQQIYADKYNFYGKQILG